MPKTTNTKALRFAPYVPLRGYKVNSQLTNKAEDTLLRELVTQLGGTMVGIQHSVSYYVHDKGEGCAADEMSPALADFIGRHTNQYDQLITRESMFEKLNELLSKTCPLNDGLVIRFRNTLYPIRNHTYSPTGVSLLPDSGANTIVDVAVLTYQPYKKDAWETTNVVRFQLLAVSSKYIGVHLDESLFTLAHDENLMTLLFRREFDTLNEGRTWVETEVKTLLHLDLRSLKVGTKTKVNTLNAEVIEFANELEEAL